MTAAEAYAARWDLSPYPTPRPIPIIPRQATAELNYSYPNSSIKPLATQSSLPSDIPSPQVETVQIRKKSRPSISFDFSNNVSSGSPDHSEKCHLTTHLIYKS